MSNVGNNMLDYTNRDYESVRNDLVSTLPKYLPEYTDTSELDPGIVILELISRGIDILNFYQDSQANEVFLQYAQQRENILANSYSLGYTPAEATPSIFDLVFVLNSIQKQDVTIPMGFKVHTVKTEVDSEVYFETTENLVIPAGKLGNEKDTSGNYFYTVEAIQGQTIESELVGTSTGAENQEFTLSYAPVIYTSVSLLINEGTGFTQWDRVDNFIDSLPDSKHFRVVLNMDNKAKIIFGNGVSGKIPKPYKNGIYAYYRIGGGTIGNVGENTITEMDTRPAVIKECFNPKRARVQATDKETNDEVRINAPKYNMTKYAPVREEDHSYLVLKEFKTKVKYASAIRDPDDVDLIDLYVLVREEYSNTFTLDDTLKAEIEAYFSECQIVGCKLKAYPPVYKSIGLDCTLDVKETFLRDEVKANVEQYLRQYFKVGYYDFGQELSITDLEGLVSTSIDGIRVFRINTTPLTIVPAKSEILTLGSLTISATGGVKVVTN